MCNRDIVLFFTDFLLISAFLCGTISYKKGGDNLPASKAKMKAIAKYEQKAYDKILLRLPKGTGDKIKAAAGEGGSVNGFIREAVEARLNGATPTPTAGNAPETPQKAAGAILGGVAVSLPSEEEKRLQNATEAETGRTPCTVDSKIYSYAINGAKVKGQTINQYLDKAVDVWNYETAKLAAARANEPTAEQKAAFEKQQQQEAEQRRRETAPKDWRETVDGKPLPVVPVTPADRYAVNMAKIQEKIDQAKKKPETEAT